MDLSHDRAKWLWWSMSVFANPVLWDPQTVYIFATGCWEGVETWTAADPQGTDWETLVYVTETHGLCDQAALLDQLGMARRSKGPRWWWVSAKNWIGSSSRCGSPSPSPQCAPVDPSGTWSAPAWHSHCWCAAETARRTLQSQKVQK